jgi:hypothetical protein
VGEVLAAASVRRHLADAVWAVSGRSRSEPVGGAADAEWAAIENVGVDHGGPEVAVAEELLDGADVGAVLQEVGREGVPEGVAGDAFRDAGGGGRAADGALDARLVEVVAEPLAGGVVRSGS